MTDPSNANTSGLEVVAWRFRDHPGNGWIYTGLGDRHEGCEVEPLVTAASAQARIDAAEARADRLAKALEEIEGYDWPVIVGHDVQTSVGQATGAVYENRFPIAKETALSAFNRVKAIARAALQQETQK